MTGMRIVVAGVAGGGKSYVAARIASARELPLIEPGTMYHLPNWEPAPADDFRRDVIAALDAEPRGWVVDGNYDAVAEDLWARADMVVWLDLPRWRVMVQLARRTTTRIIRRTPLYNGNRETIASGFGPTGMLVSAWQAHPRRRAQREQLAARADELGIALVELRSRREVDRWLAGSAP